MIDVMLTRLLPAFLLEDKNGYAMAKAIERALFLLCDTIRTGVECVQNIEQMPEWRLDELAWEQGCLYDYSADAETKRRWLRDTTQLYAALGTPQAIFQFLQGYFADVELEECWQYGGEPFHFRVIVSGEWNENNADWARRAIAAAKNARSVLDEFALGSHCQIAIGCESAIGVADLPLCGSIICGQWPPN